MKTYLDCYPCFLRQALEAARMAGAGEVQQSQVIRAVLGMLQETNPAATPPEIGDRIHRRVRAMLGTGDHVTPCRNGADPYAAVKSTATQEALALYPRLTTLVAEAGDPLERAVRIAIAGNIIDFGPSAAYDLTATLDRVLKQPFAVDNLDALRAALDEGGPLLYLGDNAGETVFDRVLIETLDRPVTYAVKGGPTLNDATLADAVAAGLDDVATLITTGVDAPGTMLKRSSDAFQQRYAEAGVIIAKGQANYETLSPGDSRLFFLLKVKCPVIGRDLVVETGAIVVKQGRGPLPSRSVLDEPRR
jgi:hypothetical protein